MVRSYLLFPVAVLMVTAAVCPAQERPRFGMNPERMHLIKLWRLVDELEVDEEQAATFFPVWSKHERERKEILKRRKEATEELSELLDAESHKKIEAQLSVVREIDAELQDLDRQFKERLGDVLSVNQEAKLLLFEDRFRTDLRLLVRDFQGMRRGKGRAPGWKRQD
jgi:Spy/CpxP family protein refolding chaperone